MSEMIAYLCVSTDRQGRSGLGLDAQRETIRRFAEAEKLELAGEHVEVETGKVSTPEQDCIAFRSKDASIMPTRMPSSTGLPRGRQVGVISSLGVSGLLRRERRLL